MPRGPRLESPGIPMHIVQRGVNRAAVFLRNEDRGYYLSLLDDALGNEEAVLHACVPMGNHVHLLVSCPAAGRIPRAMSRAALINFLRLIASDPFPPCRSSQIAEIAGKLRNLSNRSPHFA